MFIRFEKNRHFNLIYETEFMAIFARLSIVYLSTKYFLFIFMRFSFRVASSKWLELHGALFNFVICYIIFR